MYPIHAYGSEDQKKKLEEIKKVKDKLCTTTNELYSAIHNLSKALSDPTLLDSTDTETIRDKIMQEYVKKEVAE